MTGRKHRDIVDAASKLFIKHGFHPVGVDLIIEKSGISRMTMYRNFQGKEGVVREVLEQRHTQVMDNLSELVTNKHSAIDRLKAIFQWHENWFSSNDFCGCLFERAIAEFDSNQKVHNIAVQHKRALRELLMEILKEELPISTADELADVMLLLLDGAISNAKAFGNADIAKTAWRAAEKILTAAGLKTH